MKKLGILTLAAVAAMLTTGTAMAANEEGVEFSQVDTNGAAIYTTSYYGTNGGIRFEPLNYDISPLPYGMQNQGDIYSFCCYNGRIYYLTGEAASDTVPARIYSCNMSGGDNVLIADNASNYSKVTIVDNVLYYDAYNSRYSDYYTGYYGGIYKIDFNNNTWAKLVKEPTATMSYCDGDYIYYVTDYGYYAIDTNGNNCMEAARFCDEFDTVYGNCVIKGNRTYYIFNNTLYSRDRNGEGYKKWCSVPVNSQIVGVHGDYVFIASFSEVSWSAFVYTYDKSFADTSSIEY